MKKIFYILSAAAILAAACTREMAPEQSVRPTTTVAPKDGDMALVTFKVNVPEAALYATQTRAQHAIGEQPAIADGDLYVAVFGGGDDEKLGGNLQHFLKAKLNNTIVHDYTDEDDATITYTYEYEILIPLSDDPLVLEFMVGACDKDGNLYTLENPLPVKYEAELMPTLFSRDGFAAYWQRIRVDGVFPKKNADGSFMTTGYTDDGGAMLPDASQDYVAEDIEALEYVQLIRNFAKVTFTVDEEAPFTLDGFYLLDTPVSGSVAPYSVSAGYNTVYTTATSAGAIIGTYEGYVNSQVLSSGIDGKEFLDPGVFDYMYERTVPGYSYDFAESGAMLKITWKDIDDVDEALRGETRYYKVVFKGNEGYLPILRNIQYNFEIKDIDSEQHYRTPAAAYAGSWLGDISANVATAMLDEMSNRKSSIKVSEMAKTSIGDSKSFEIDFYFYPIAGNPEVVVTNGKMSTAAGKTVTIAATMMTEGSYDQAILTVSDPVVTSNADGTDNHATVTVTVKPSETGKVMKGKVRILGQVAGMTALYRDVIFTVMEKQEFISSAGTESSVTPLVSDSMGEEVTVTIQLPDALPRDIFPLQIKIEAENNGLYSVSDTSVNPEISALPVKSGPSAFATGKNSYYFLKTITFDEYATLNGLTYDYTTAFPCKFKTRLAAGSNATKIRINDLNEEYFNQKELELQVGS